MLEVLCERRPLELRATEPKDMLLLQSVWQAHERRKIITVADPRLLLNYQPFPLADTPCKDEATNSAMHMHPCSSLSSESNNVAMNSSSSVTIEVNGFEVEKAMVKNLLHLGLL